MKRVNVKASFLMTVLSLGVLISCEVNALEDAVKEDVTEEITLKAGDLSNPINVGELDDRTTAYDYAEQTVDGNRYGLYRVKAGTSTDNNSPRMERKFTPRVKPTAGNYQLFKATFRIEEVGGTRGTYFCQVKGTHTNHIDVDPALALFIARKVVVNNKTYFDIYREQITKRDGKFSNNGRKDVLLTRVGKDEDFTVELKTGFDGNPFRHYANIKINGKWYYWNVPSPELAEETGIRYGAYSVTSGNARIRVRATTFSQKNN